MARPIGSGVIPLEIRLYSKLKKLNNGCWVYPAKNGNGYGRIYYSGKQLYSHRVSYEICFGKIPKGLLVDHKCRNRACINPAHMDIVTPKENVQRGLRGSLITSCPAGHKYNFENTLYRKYRNNGQHRRCKKCHSDRERKAKRWAKKSIR